MTKKNFALVCLLAFSLSPACGQPSTSPSAIIGGVWKIRSFETYSGSIIGTTNTNGYTVSFLDGGKLASRADCNQCTGSYAISGDSLQIGPLACTKAICASGSYDKLFLDILTNATTFGVQGIELSIIAPNNGTLRMIQ
jgi:heat shock protein HslJ